jgi:hypothetical protein
MATLSIQRSGPSLAERVKSLQRNAAEAVRAVGDIALAALQDTAPRDKMGPPYRLYDTLMTTTTSTEYFYGIGPLSAMGSPERPAPPHTIRDFLNWYRAEARRRRQDREERLAKQRAEKRLAREQKRAARVAKLEAWPKAKTGPSSPARDYKHLAQAARQRKYYHSRKATLQRMYYVISSVAFRYRRSVAAFKRREYYERANYMETTKTLNRLRRIRNRWGREYGRRVKEFVELAEKLYKTTGKKGYLRYMRDFLREMQRYLRGRGGEEWL